MIANVFLLRDRQFCTKEIAHTLMMKAAKQLDDRDDNKVDKTAAELTREASNTNRPLWICLIDKVVLSRVAPSDGMSLQEALQPLIQRRESLVELLEARAAIRQVQLIYRNEEQGPICENHRFSPSDLSLDQMVQLVTLDERPLRRVAIDCVGTWPSFSLFAHLHYCFGGKRTLSLCSNFKKQYVSKPILETEVADVRLFSYSALVFPVFIELI